MDLPFACVIFCGYKNPCLLNIDFPNSKAYTKFRMTCKFAISQCVDGLVVKHLSLFENDEGSIIDFGVDDFGTWEVCMRLEK